MLVPTPAFLERIWSDDEENPHSSSSSCGKNNNNKKKNGYFWDFLVVFAHVKWSPVCGIFQETREGWKTLMCLDPNFSTLNQKNLET